MRAFSHDVAQALEERLPARATPLRARLYAGAAALCLVVPLQPAGEQHHYTIILAPLLLTLLLAMQPARRAPALATPPLATSPAPRTLVVAALLALAVALFLAPPFFLDNAAWAGWPRALLAYPRLYGALALWAALLVAAHPRSRRAS